MPIHAQFGESMVERRPVRLFRVGQGAVDIEDEGLKGGRVHERLSNGMVGKVYSSVRVNLLYPRKLINSNHVY